MTKRRRLLFVLGALLLAIAGCQLIAGVQSRTADPLNPGCVLPNAAGFPLVRVANLAPTSDQVDVCLRIAGTSSWGGVLPIVINGGIDGPAGEDGGVTSPSCTTILGASGFTYGTVSLLFSAPGQNIDVKMIPGGSACSATAIAETDGITLATNANTTLALMGGNNVAETVVPLPEADSVNQAAQRYRVVHAAPGTGPLDFGTTASASLPTTITIDILSGPVPYGGTVPSGVTATTPTIPLEDNGYLALPTGSEYVGANVDGGPPNAVFVWNAQSGADTFSMYVIGIAGDNTYPLRALVCHEDAPAATAGQLLSSCTLSTLSNLSVDVFNTALYGEDAPNFKAREGLIPGAIAARTSDLMCVVEVDLNGSNCAQCLNDQQDIISGAKANYPYSYTLNDLSLSTPFNNPANQQGVTPPAPTQPPCAGVSPDLINAPVSCMEQNCSSVDGGSGFLDQPTSCLTQNCPSSFLELEAANAACFDCLVVNIASSQSYADSVTACTTDSRPPLGFQGVENSIILSRYPLVDTDALILPSTDYRRSVLYAKVQLEEGQTVDFYCGFLITTENAGVEPYVGNYGNGPVTDAGTASADGWDNEQIWEATQMVNWINAKSGTGVDGGTADGGAPSPAIVVGDWHSSVGVPGTAPQGIFLPNALNPGTMNVMTSQSNWFAATPGASSGSKWTPQCNDCPPPENPYNGPTDQYFFSQPFLVNWPSDQVQAATIDESLILNQPVLSLDAGLQGPLSPYYGVNITVIRPH